MELITTNIHEAQRVLNSCNNAIAIGCFTSYTQSLKNILQTVLFHNHGQERIVIEVTLSEKEEWQSRGGNKD